MSPADASEPGLSRLLYVDDDPTLTVLTRISLERSRNTNELAIDPILRHAQRCIAVTAQVEK